MDLTIPKPIEELRARIAAFVESEIVPLERDPSAYDAHENIHEGVLRRLRGKAREARLWCLQLPSELGGLGIGRYSGPSSSTRPRPTTAT